MTALGCANLADGSSGAASSWCSLEMLFGRFKLFRSWHWTNMRIKLLSPPPPTPLYVMPSPNWMPQRICIKNLEFNLETYWIGCCICTISICTAIGCHILHPVGKYSGPDMVHCNNESWRLTSSLVIVTKSPSAKTGCLLASHENQGTFPATAFWVSSNGEAWKGQV